MSKLDGLNYTPREINRVILARKGSWIMKMMKNILTILIISILYLSCFGIGIHYNIERPFQPDNRKHLQVYVIKHFRIIHTIDGKRAKLTVDSDVFIHVWKYGKVWDFLRIIKFIYGSQIKLIT